MPENVFLISFGSKFLLTSAWIQKYMKSVVFSNKSIQKGPNDLSADLIELVFFYWNDIFIIFSWDQQNTFQILEKSWQSTQKFFLAIITLGRATINRNYSNVYYICFFQMYWSLKLNRSIYADVSRNSVKIPGNAIYKCRICILGKSATDDWMDGTYGTMTRNWFLCII